MSDNITLIKVALEAVYIDALNKNIVEAGLISALFIQEDNLHLVIEFQESMVIDQQAITEQIEKILQAKFSYLSEIKIIFSSKKALTKPVPISKVKHNIPNVEKIILLASAKGGVGKSTTATNLAIALAKLGFAVGLVDADIYGPTIPKLLDIQQKPETSEGKMLPIKKYGIYSMSIGYIINEDQAAIWRGPMISKALYQLLVGVKWPKLDYLIVDMPPGTGDIYLSLAENFVINGVILLTTPQHIALAMVKKSISFFNKTNIPIIGIIENMSYFYDADNNITHNIFGASLSKEKSDSMNINLLGNIPLIAKISQFSDQGLCLEKEKEFTVYLEIAQKVSNFAL